MRTRFPAAAGAPNGVVPAHRGARAFFAGEEMPMTDDRAAAPASRPLHRGAEPESFSAIAGRALIVFALLPFTVGPRAGAHETIDAEQGERHARRR